MGGALALAIALLLGWLAGNWAACTNDDCSFDAELFGALGTWVGGIGTILALGFAALQFSGDMEERMRTRQREDQARAEALERATDEAQAVNVVVRMNITQAGMGIGATAAVLNWANETPIFTVEGSVPGFPPLAVAQIGPKSSSPERRRSMRGQTDPDPVPLPEGGWSEWTEEQIAASWVEFDMNKHRWRREGRNPARRVGSARG